MKILILSLFCLTTVHSVTKPKTCGKNEVYAACKDPCPKTCESIISTAPQIACLPPNPCPGGCNCIPNHVRNSAGACVPISSCPPAKTCGKNETYVSCKNPCPQTCKDLFNTGPQVACAAPFPCPPGCDCKSEYVRDSNNKCISKSDCPPPPSCGGDANAESKPCGDPCPTTCENMSDTGPRPCPAICIVDGCVCKPGFVKNTSTGKCILPQECPPPPGCGGDPNAESQPCGDPCPTTCENMSDTGARPCPAICLIDGCVCKPGFVKNTSTGKCIQPQECPPQICPPNEEYVPCPQYCTFDEDCGSYVEGWIRDCAAPPDEPLPCAPTCRCKPGFLRIDGNCVLPAECCPAPSQLLVDCPAPCDRNCTFTPKPGCVQECPLRKCICANNYVRIGETCVPETNCPKKVTPKPTSKPTPKLTTPKPTTHKPTTPKRTTMKPTTPKRTNYK